MGRVFKELAKFDKAKKLGHGLIFIGGRKSEVLNDIRAFARTLEGEDVTANTPLVDAHFFGARGESSMGIDSVRELKNFLALRSAKSSRRLAVIEDGSVLTRDAQSALLKVSEEPPEGALIIILLQNEDQLMPTVRSRFERIHIYEGADAPKEVETTEERRALTLAKRFLSVERRERGEIIKQVIGKTDDEDVPDITTLFLDALIGELAKNITKNGPFLKQVLERKRLLGRYNLNKRLQLDFLSGLWYNS